VTSAATSRGWLAANVGIVLVFGAFDLRFTR
jgi:hypothetical protein